MVGVPVYEPNSVQTRPLADTRISPAIPDEAFGAGVAQAVGAVGKSLDVATQTLAQHYERVDEAKVKDLDLEWSATERANLWDGDDAFYKKSGQAAVDAQDAARDRLKKAADELLAKAESPRQKQLLRQTLTQRLEAAYMQMGRFSAAQGEQAWTDASAARVADAVDMGARSYTDPAAIGVQANRIRSEVQARADRFHWTAEQQEKETVEALSQLHAGVVAQLLDADAARAKVYLETHSGEMDARTLAGLRPRVAAEAKAQAGYTEAQAIYDLKGYDGLVSAASAQKDPDKARTFYSVAATRHAAEQNIDTDRRRDAVREAYARIEKGNNPDAWPESFRAVVGEHMDTLRNAYKARLQGSQPLENGPAYLSALAMQTTPEGRRQFANLDVVATYAGSIPPKELAKLLEDQKQIANGNDPNQKANVAFNQAWVVASNIASAYGVLKNKDRTGQLREFVMREVLQRLRLGQDVDASAAAQIAKTALIPQYHDGIFGPGQKGAFFFESEQNGNGPDPAAMRSVNPALWNQLSGMWSMHKGQPTVSNSEVSKAAAFYEATGGRALVHYRDIPPSIRRQIEAKGSHTKEQVEAVYTAGLIAAWKNR